MRQHTHKTGETLTESSPLSPLKTNHRPKEFIKSIKIRTTEASQTMVSSD